MSIIPTELTTDDKHVTQEEHLQHSIEETQPSGSAVVRDVLRVRRPKKKKKKNKRVPRRMFFYDSNEGSEECMPD